jgi:hypothetical protein
VHEYEKLEYSLTCFHLLEMNMPHYYKTAHDNSSWKEKGRDAMVVIQDVGGGIGLGNAIFKWEVHFASRTSPDGRVSSS